MWEKPSSHSEDRAYEERLKEQRKLEAQKEQSRPPESDQDKQMKVVISERLPVMREEFQKQVKDWQERVKALREKEYSFSNFVTPENYWGFSTIIRWDGNTNSWAKVDIVEAYSELMGMRNIALPRIEFALKEWKRWEDIQKDPLMKSFLDSPEWKLMTSQSPSPDEAMADFYLDKARELRKRIPKWELLAQPLYEKLKWTKHEAVAKQEMMNIAEEVWKKYVSEIGNELLWTDSLLVMAASWPVWGMISKWVKSERLIQASVGTMEAVNTSRLAKVLVPWVKVVQTEASNGTLLKVGKWTLNVWADAAKIGLYHEAVRYLWGNDAAKIAGYMLLFIPWAKAGFERDMKAKFWTVAPTSANISAWALEKYGEDNLKKMLWNQWEEIVKQMKEIAATATKNTTATEIWAQGVRTLSTQRVQSNNPQKNPETTPPSPTTMEAPRVREWRFDIENNPVYQEFPFLKKYAEILWDLKPSDIISDIGTQALIVKPRTLRGFVAKIERPNAEDKVIGEYNNHVKAYNIWKEWRKNWGIPENIFVPKIQLPRWVDEGIILIEQVQGQSLHTKALIENAYKIRKDAPPLTQEEMALVSTFTDGDAKRFIMQKYNYSADEAFRVIELYSADKLWPYLHDRMRPTFRTDLSKAMEYMSKQQPWISQWDQHPWNFMVTNDGKIYIIDWWRAKMTNVPNPSNP